MNTQVELFDTSLTLISIPLNAYPFFCQGIIRLALGEWKDDYKEPRRLSLQRLEDNSNISTPTSSLPPNDLLENFINISFTPIECSIICPTQLVDLLFGKVLQTIGNLISVKILKDEYVAIKVDTDGEDTSSSVLKISYPLSSAGIPIFFISTYFSDYVLVPVRERHRVIRTLELENFIFSDISNSYMWVGENDRSEDREGQVEEVQSKEEIKFPPSDKILSLFQTHNVNPLTNDRKLLLTGARTGLSSESEVYLSIVKILLSPPEFFSLTIISGAEISFLVDSETSNLFPSHILLGSPTDFVLPISFDLSNLPEDSTGIISGLASIFSNTKEMVHMRYLSTALTSIILVSDDDFDSAIKVFEK